MIQAGRDNDPSNLIEIPPITGPVHMMIRKTLDYLKTNIITNQTYNRRKFLDPLLELDLIEVVNKESKKQRYKITGTGVSVLQAYKSR